MVDRNVEGSYEIAQLLNCFFGEEMDRNAVAVFDGVDPEMKGGGTW